MRLGNRVCRIEDGLLVAVFVVALWLPLVGAGLRWGVLTPEQESRRLAPFPPLPSGLRELRSLPGAFAAYLKDNFGFRGTLIRSQAVVRVKLLGVSTSPRVMLGKQGWLFSSPEFSDRGDRAVPLLNARQLEEWRKVFEARRDWLARRGIRYVFAFSPNKQDIYPEYMPDAFKTGETTRMDQLLDYLKKNSDVEVLDLRPALEEAKPQHQLYYKTDQHMSYRGSFIAYQLLARELSKTFPSIKPLSESDFVVSVKTFSGDQSTVLGLKGILTEEVEVLSLREPAYTGAARPPDAPLYIHDKYTTDGKDQSLPRLVMFYDSGFGRVGLFLAQHFSRAAFAGFPELDPELVKAEHPDVVVQESSELNLMEDPPVDPPEVRSLRFPAEGQGAQNIVGGPPPEYNGYQDVTNCLYVAGWAWDSSRPDEVINVAVYDGDQLLAVIPAYQFRQDLLDDHIGHGDHGFIYFFPRALKDGQPHQIHVKVAGSGFELHNSPASMSCETK